MKAVRTSCMVMLVAAPAGAFAQDKSYYPATPPLYDWSKFQPPENGSRWSDQLNMPSIITGRSIAGRATPMVTPSGTTLPLYDWSKFQPPENGSRWSDQSNMPSMITGRSIAGRASAWAEVFSPTPMVTPSGTTLPLYDWSKFHRQKTR